MLSVKTKEHIRRRLERALPKYGALAGGMATLVVLILWVGSLVQVVTVTDTRGAQATLVTAAQKPGVLVAQAGMAPLSEHDEVLWTQQEDGSASLHVLRAYTVPVTADGETREVITTGATTAELLAAAGLTAGENDRTEPAMDAAVQEGQSVTLTRIVYQDYTVEEILPHETQTVGTSLFYRCQDYVQTIQEGVDGVDLVTYRETWADGVLVSTEETARGTQVAVQTEILKQYEEGKAVSAYVGPEIVDGQPAEGVAAVYTGRRATGYSASATAKGASGRRLNYGTVAVDPNIIPYGSLMYITSDDGRFIYGYAYAADTGAAMMTVHAFIDLYYETYDESCKNAVIPVTVYVLDEETAAQYKEQNDALLEADTFPGL